MLPPPCHRHQSPLKHQAMETTLPEITSISATQTHMESHSLDPGDANQNGDSRDSDDSREIGDSGEFENFKETGDSEERNQGSNTKFRFHCNWCNYTTDRKNNMKRHIQTMHELSVAALECCGLRFLNKAEQKMHNEEFHKDGFPCSHCKRKFCRKALLKRHLSVHTGVKPYACQVCAYATSHKSNLERHMRVHQKLPGTFVRPWESLSPPVGYGGLLHASLYHDLCSPPMLRPATLLPRPHHPQEGLARPPHIKSPQHGWSAASSVAARPALGVAVIKPIPVRPGATLGIPLQAPPAAAATAPHILTTPATSHMLGGTHVFGGPYTGDVHPTLRVPGSLNDAYSLGMQRALSSRHTHKLHSLVGNHTLSCQNSLGAAHTLGGQMSCTPIRPVDMTSRAQTTPSTDPHTSPAASVCSIPEVEEEYVPKKLRVSKKFQCRRDA